jgi:hypothetical protein
MALWEQKNNYVKLRTTPLTINGQANSVHDYESIHITKFDARLIKEDMIAFFNGNRTALVITGDDMADDFDGKTVAQVMTDANTFMDSLEETTA